MSVRKTLFRGKPRWVIDFRFTDKTGAKQRFRKAADVNTASAARAEEARLRQHCAEHGEPYTCRLSMTFADFVDGPWKAWVSRHKPSTRERYDALMGQGLLDAFGKLRLDEVTAQHITEYASLLTRDRVQAWPHISLVSSVLRAAVALGELAEMPKLPPVRKRKRKLPSCPRTEDIVALITWCRGWLRLAVALAAYAGLRSGEVRALEASDVDLARGEIHVRRAMSADEVATTKSDEERTVPIAPELRPHLEVACRGKRGRLVLTERGDAPSRQKILDRLTRVQTRHHLVRHSFHAIRHYFCTSLLRRGADVETVRVVAGHQDIATTARYLHAGVEDARRVMLGQTQVKQSEPSLN